MSTISASTTSTTAYKVTADTTGTLVFQTGATPTTAMTLGTDQSVTFAGTQTYTGAATFTSGITVQGLTVGKGAGAVATNTAVGVSALAGANTGGNNVAVGSTAGYTNTSGIRNVFVGRAAGYTNNGQDNTFVGDFAGNATSSGNYNVSVGSGSLQSNTTASYNTAVGTSAFYANTTGSNGVAVGGLALTANTTGVSNTAIGTQALTANTTASNNTAVGYQAGYTNSTGIENVFLGSQAGYSSNASGSVYVGYYSGQATTGLGNTFIGNGSGYLVTSGTKNTILGKYNGNAGGFDIRTSSNYIVLSDGDGNPSIVKASTDQVFVGLGTQNYSGTVYLLGYAASGYGPTLVGQTGPYGSSVTRWYAGSRSYIKNNTDYDSFCVASGSGASGGVYVASGQTSWTSASDERLKDIIEPITDAANKVSTLRAVIGKYKTDEEGIRRSFLIAQDVQAVLPEAVDARDPDELGVQYTDVIPLLVAAIKELKAELDTAKAQIAALQGASA